MRLIRGMLVIGNRPPLGLPILSIIFSLTLFSAFVAYNVISRGKGDQEKTDISNQIFNVRVVAIVYSVVLLIMIGFGITVSTRFFQGKYALPPTVLEQDEYVSTMRHSQISSLEAL